MFASRNRSESRAPSARSKAGITTPRIVPGRMVERMTTVCGRPFAAIAAPISSQTRSTAEVSRLPFLREGVPTQTRLRSVAATASAAEVVARRRPAATASSISSLTFFSMIGALPELTMATLAGWGSTPTTSCPSRARQAAETTPT